jgi:hypothetical protein
MAKTDFNFEFRGYLDHETSMRDRIARLPPEDFGTISPLLDALHEAGVNDGGGKFLAITIVGHADRFDVAGQTPEQRRAVELQNSQARADSAAEFFLQKLTDMQPPFPTTSWKDVPNVSMHVVAAGAADLIITVPATEQDRQQNRRVVLFVTANGIVTSAIPADGTGVVFA